MLSFIRSATAARAAAPNAGNYALINEIKKLGLTKGYVNYWDGAINTYLSDGSIKFLPVVCTDHDRTVPYYLLVDSTLYTRRAAKTFYLVDPTFTMPANCSERQILAQFGKPQQTVRMHRKTILVYNHDLIRDMQQ
jgi:hypothetical protein